MAYRRASAFVESFVESGGINFEIRTLGVASERLLARAKGHPGRGAYLDVLAYDEAFIAWALPRFLQGVPTEADTLALRGQVADLAEAMRTSFATHAFPDSSEQAKWEADKLYRTVIDETRPKHYALTMLPYPSGDLHIGHWYAMTPSDSRARFMRMRG